MSLLHEGTVSGGTAYNRPILAGEFVVGRVTPRGEKEFAQQTQMQIVSTDRWHECWRTRTPVATSTSE
jgi:hypothetical protein